MLEETIERLNLNKIENKININRENVDITPLNGDIPKTKRLMGRKPSTLLTTEGNKKLNELFLPSIEILGAVIRGKQSIPERSLQACMYVIDQVRGKAKVQADITHGVKPYNQIIRELNSAEGESQDGLSTGIYEETQV
jgi:hypothetical protein